MTKTFKSICTIFVVALLALVLVGCSAEKKYEKYAEKIRVAEAKNEALTYAEVIDKLGAPTINLTTSIFGSGETGWCTWYDGCDTTEELNEKLEAGKKVAYISVSFSGGKAVDAKTGVEAPKEEK